MIAQAQRPQHGFICYARADREIVWKLREHLAAIEVMHGFKFWCDESDIGAGDEWEKAILDAINRADVILAAVSSAAIASKFIIDKELPAIRQRYNANPKTLVMPVWLARSERGAYLAKRQWVPLLDGRLTPLAEWPSLNNACHQVQQQVDAQIARYYGPADEIC